MHWCNRNCSPQITTIPQSRLPNLRPEIYAHIGLGSPLKHCLTSSGNACRTTTCRLCEYQCCVLGNIALQSIVVGLAACKAIMLPARQYWPSLCLNSRPGPQGISTNIGLPKGDCSYAVMLLPPPPKQGEEEDIGYCCPRACGPRATIANVFLLALFWGG